MTAAPHDSFDPLTDDALTARVRVYQRRNGHRYSFDDVVTAWVALTHAGAPRTCLDLGTGLGSVLLMLADRLPEARLWGIEAQEVSYALARRNIERNGFSGRVQAELGDLRDAMLLARLRAAAEVQASSGFQLVTGTPPYKPVGTATPSPDAQRAHARVELRGGVEDYLLAASRVLALDGLCVVCAEAGAEPRVRRGASLAGLSYAARMDVVPMLGRKGRLFAVHLLRHGMSLQPTAAEPEVLPRLVLRDERGARTEAARALRSFFGLSGAEHEAPSPVLRARRAAAPYDSSLGEEA